MAAYASRRLWWRGIAPRDLPLGNGRVGRTLPGAALAPLSAGSAEWDGVGRRRWQGSARSRSAGLAAETGDVE